jgi:hypothetical protein
MAPVVINKHNMYDNHADEHPMGATLLASAATSQTSYSTLVLVGLAA